LTVKSQMQNVTVKLKLNLECYSFGALCKFQGTNFDIFDFILASGQLENRFVALKT